MGLVRSQAESSTNRSTARFSRRVLLSAGFGSLVAACGVARVAEPPTPTAAPAPPVPSPTAVEPTVPPVATPAPTTPITPTALPSATAIASPTAAPASPTAVPEPPTHTALPAASATPVPAPPRAPLQPKAAPPTPAPSAAGSNDAPGLPVAIAIPRLRINAAVEHVGLAPDGAMDVPKRYDTVGWYKLGSRPGERGSAVVAGHLDSKTGPAIFWRLGDLRPGDAIAVRSNDGVERRFTVEALETYRYDAAPLERIFAAADRARLNLITCNGVFDRRAQNYDLRLVVFTTLAS